MAIESVIELKINGLEQLEQLEQRFSKLRDASVNLGGAAPSEPSTPHATGRPNIEFRNEMHSFSRELRMAGNGLVNLTSGFMKLSKAILGTGGLLSGVTSMATVAGMLKTAQNINQNAFMTNAAGMNPNDLNRLKATYGQLFNVESVASSIAREKSAPYSMLMTQMGLTQQQAQGMTTEELMKRVSGHARMMAQQYGANELALKAGGLEGVMSVDDLLRELNIKPEQQATIGRLSEKYAGLTQLQKPEEWQRFNSLMSLGTQAVGTKMENLLRPLLDPLFKVFDSFFDRVFGNENQRKWEEVIESVRSGLENVSEFIRTGSWEQLWDKIKETVEQPLVKFGNYIETTFAPQLAQLENAFNFLKAAVDLVSDAFKGVYDYMIKMGVIKTPAQATSDLNKSTREFDEFFTKAEAPIAKSAFRKAAEQEVARRGLPPEMADFLEAQAAQETANFKSVNGWNFGNITGEYKGKYRVRGDKDAQGRPIQQKFRVYQGADESVRDMLDLLQSSYPEAYGAKTIDEYTGGLTHGRGGRRWAEDPGYMAHVKGAYHPSRRVQPMTGGERAVYGSNPEVKMTVRNETTGQLDLQSMKTQGAPNGGSR